MIILMVWRRVPSSLLRLLLRRDNIKGVFWIVIDAKMIMRAIPAVVCMHDIPNLASW